MIEGNKQVRVENWGTFFLQRLQVFFAKTDYCDLTLQFDGNVQLKVHRLVMNACTEYFRFLEDNCSAMEDNTILMPSDLQSDVIVPIVNFMYTGEVTILVKYCFLLISNSVFRRNIKVMMDNGCFKNIICYFC